MIQYLRQHAIFAVICLCFVSIFFSITKGSVSLSLNQLLFSKESSDAILFFDLRLPRTLTAFVTGGLLALAGNLMQVLLKNPLADPYVLGASSGAAFFTLLFMLLGIATQFLFVGAWLGSLSTMALILMLANKHHWQSQTLLLIGVAIACGFSAGITAILLVSPTTNLHSMLFWLTGDLNDATYPWLGLSILSGGFIFCMMLAPGLNVLARGDKEARALGLATTHFHRALYFLSSLFTASAITLAGGIGFIGLIIPHMSRQLVGYDHRLLLPVSMLLGGSLLTVADTFARTLFAPQQLPVGLVMTMIGVPVFIWLLQK